MNLGVRHGDDGVISPEMLDRLREHFAAGPEIAGEPRPLPHRRAPVVPAQLRVIELAIPSRGGAQIVATDGSAHYGDDGVAHVAGCAAVAADGRAMLASFDLPPAARPIASLYAEWQGARLGLRLAEGWTSGRLLTDNQAVAGQLQAIRSGRRTQPPTIGGNDKPAMEEIHRRARATPVSVRLVTNGASTYTAASVPLLRSAHAGAWLIRRLAADHIDPAGHTDWLAEVISRGPRLRKRLRGGLPVPDARHLTAYPSTPGRRS